MSTDKEIRQFIRDNMPQIKGNERFMAELVRQIELLPVPASLSGKTDEEIRTAMDLISAAARKIKRRNRIKAVSAAAVSSGLNIIDSRSYQRISPVQADCPKASL